MMFRTGHIPAESLVKRLGAIVASIGATVSLMVLGVARLRSRQRRWGATQEECDRAMPGDDIVLEPSYITTRAITVHARPEEIYPWLLQMGYGRGGLYSYDFLDRVFGVLDAPSAKEILPEFQHLAVGDAITAGRGGDFPVRELRTNEVFVLGDSAVGWSWATCLYPIDDEHTRLVTRNRGAIDGHVRWRVFFFTFDIAAFIMVRRWLIVLKQRAEMLAEWRRLAARETPSEPITS